MLLFPCLLELEEVKIKLLNAKYSHPTNVGKAAFAVFKLDHWI